MSKRIVGALAAILLTLLAMLLIPAAAVAGSYLRLAHLSYTVATRPAGADPASPPVISASLHAVDGRAHSVAGLGKFASLALRVPGDEIGLPPALQARMRVINAAPLAGDLTVNRAGAAVIENAAFGQTTPTFWCRPGRRCSTWCPSRRPPPRCRSPSMPAACTACWCWRRVGCSRRRRGGGGRPGGPARAGRRPADDPIDPTGLGDRAGAGHPGAGGPAAADPDPGRSAWTARSSTSGWTPRARWSRRRRPTGSAGSPRAPRRGRWGPRCSPGTWTPGPGPACSTGWWTRARATPSRSSEPDGSTITFTVVSTARVAKTAFPTELIYAPLPVPLLRLVTCGGTFDRAARSYRDNVIVEAVPSE